MSKHFPRVFKGHGHLYIVYRNRVECFEKEYSQSYKELRKENGIDDYNAYNDITMLKNNGFKEVHYKSEEQS